MSDNENPVFRNERRHTIKIKLPWGEIEIRGYDVIMLILVACIPFGTYFLYEIRTDGNSAHVQIIEALQIQTYVLSLSQDQRDKLNISMPEGLRKQLR